MSKLACRADVWYNTHRNLLGLAMLVTSQALRRTLLGGSSMSIVLYGDIPRKQCTGPCGRTLPATNEFFVLAKKNKDGLTAKCKDCNNVEWRLKHPNAKPRGKHTPQFDVPEGQKRCTGCKDVFLATSDFFSHNKRTKDGLCWQCKKCKGETDTAYHSRPEVQDHRRSAEVRTRLNACQRDRYRSDPEYRATVAKRSKASHSRPEGREWRRIYDSEYYHDPVTRERLRVRRKEYLSRPETQERLNFYYSRPDVQERYRTHDQNRRSRKRAVAGTYTTQQIQDKLKAQKYRCYYAACGFTKFEKKDGKYLYHIDHTFPLSRIAGTDIPANSIDYLVLACPTCNMRKSNKFPHEWFEGGRLL